MQIKDKVLLITGGTGSFGTAVLNRFLETDHFKEIRIFSRDEKKQDDMRNLYKNNKIKYYIGDVRDYISVEPATRGVDYIFHAAALKQVPSCEFFPMQAVKTNVEFKLIIFQLITHIILLFLITRKNTNFTEMISK